MKQFCFHLIDIAAGRVVGFAHSNAVPRVGDEIRKGPETFYKVLHVVWCFDEVGTSAPERVNLGVERVRFGKKKR